MTTKQFALTIFLILFAALATTQAQTARLSTVNVTSDGERVHIAAEGDVSEMRVDVADESGDVVFQSGAISGQQLDWNMRDSANERVTAGMYLVTVTYRTAAGKLRKRVEQVTVDEAEEKASTKATPAAPVAVQAIVNTSGTTTTGKIPKFASPSTVTNSVITESAGKIGVGITPSAAHTGKLVVAGQIQTLGSGGGIKFADGSVQTKASIGDITSVTAGSGLDGGATTGAATLSIEPSGVSNTHLAPNAVTADKIAGGQVVKSLNSLTDDVTLTAGNNITITPAGNTLTIDATSGLSSVTHDATLTGAGTDGSPLGVAVPLTLSGAGDFKSPSAARFDLFNTNAGTGFSQHVTDKGEWQIATAGGLTRMLIDPSGNIGIGTTLPTSKLTVAGLIETTANGIKFPDGTTQTTAAGDGSVGGGGTAGQLPLWTSTTDIGDSVLTQSNGKIGIGTTDQQYKFQVIGGAGGGGVYGETSAGALYNGVYGVARDSNAIGVRGDAFFAGAIGVHGFSQFHWGVFGYSNPSTGVRGLSSQGNGVEGITTSGNGVYGETSFGTSVAGVYGKSSATSGNGVIGEAHTGSSAFGVWGKSNEGYAGYFSGNVHVNGTLSKNGGSFKIDHPLDPAHKYLSHSFVESPDMMNIYNGNITTDSNGEATVTLPRYFQALNRDFRYQLTVIGQFAQAIISGKIRGNSFQIKTDKPNVEVSWQVTGIRRDAWAEAHRIPVEEEKPEQEQGSYLHPELFNQPEEKGIEWALRPEAMRQSKERAGQRQSETKQ